MEVGIAKGTGWSRGCKSPAARERRAAVLA